jgi:glucuronate isomerase
MQDINNINHKRYKIFGPIAEIRDCAVQLYENIRNLPLICPHTHVDPKIFAQSEYMFGSPTELLVKPDHYIYRMLYSQGIPLERLGISTINGSEVETDDRKIWQIFADNYHLFYGTPSGVWFQDELNSVFGIEEILRSENAQEIYNQIDEKLKSKAFTPRNLYQRFNIEVLCTTDEIIDPLDDHIAIQNSEWPSRIIPTFRPDSVININAKDWRENISRLGHISGIPINKFTDYIQAIEERRDYFKGLGAVASDHATMSAFTEELSDQEANKIFQGALRGNISESDAKLFIGNMLIELARMSLEDGMVMQLHIGSFRNHNNFIFQNFGKDKGADIPIRAEFTSNLRPLLNKYGNDPRLRIILFTLDESTYSRELAPLAGHYPSLKIGPPWWFHDSINGMKRYLDSIMETAGVFNTVGFNDDTRAFLSIPSRHDLWRRVSCKWIANLLVTGLINEQAADDMAFALTYDLSKKAYNL